MLLTPVEIITVFIIIIKQAIQYIEQSGERDRKAGEKAKCELRVCYVHHFAGEGDFLTSV
jgi:hypothetical protein